MINSIGVVGLVWVIICNSIVEFVLKFDIMVILLVNWCWIVVSRIFCVVVFLNWVFNVVIFVCKFSFGFILKLKVLSSVIKSFFEGCFIDLVIGF